MDSIKITRLELENVKRIKAVSLEPNQDGLTIIGGKNGEGKTSVLDSIAWALGGEKRRPSNAQREGSVLPPDIRITMNNGLIVERKGKNSTLSVTDPEGKRAGQALLDSFISELALDIPKFLKQTDKEKAETLLHVIGLDNEVALSERQEKDAYDKRTMVNRMLKEKANAAEAMPEYQGVPEEYLDPAELVRKQQEVMSKNVENARIRLSVDSLRKDRDILINEISRLEEMLSQKHHDLKVLKEKLLEAEEMALTAIDEPTDEIEQQIDDFTEINRKIRANKDKRKAEAEAMAYEEEVNHLTDDINRLRNERMSLLKNADLPLPELSVDGGKLTYRGVNWDCMSASEQLMVATAIVRRLNPQCGFVLLDKLEQLDKDTLARFGNWLTNEGLQVIATRVTTDINDCTILIEDGRVAETKEIKKTEIKKWKASEENQ